MNDWLILLKLSVLFLLLFAVAEWLYRKLKVQAEYTRKIVHVGTGLLTLLFPVYFTYLWQVLLICTAFSVILLCSLRFRFLPSVNAVQRKTDGSILYPIIVSCVFAFYLCMYQKQTAFHPYLFFYLPILIMAIADPIAALAGNYFGKQSGRKTMAGSIAFFITATIISLLLFYLCGNLFIPEWLLFSMLIALATAIAERISSRGWDNFAIPFVAALLLYLMV